MNIANAFHGWHLVILILVIVLVFGAKRLPDAARSLGRSMRIFKAEVEEMKGAPSAASRETVHGQATPAPAATPQPAPAPAPTVQPTVQQAPQPAAPQPAPPAPGAPTVQQPQDGDVYRPPMA